LNGPSLPDPTLREALVEFRRANNLTVEERSSRSWTCRIWFVTLPLPNFRWRRDAILAHDLHHLLVGYPCTLWGEMRMAAWEFGAGRMPHWGARLFCVPLVSLGLLRSPRQILAAFLAGQRSRSLHEAESMERLLELDLCAARAELAARNSGEGWRNGGRFALLILESSLILMLPVAAIGGVAIALLAVMPA
jgi:hypothetical protein